MLVDGLEFEAPPINEVVMGVRFDGPIPNLLPLHFGLFWASIRDEFDKAEEVGQIADYQNIVLGKSGFPFARYWLIHKEGHYLIQLQPNMFLFNWRFTDGSYEYPRYENIKKHFRIYLDEYKNFLMRENFKVPDMCRCELTYVNLIGQEGLDRFSGGYAGLFTDLSRAGSGKRFLPNPQSINWHATYYRKEEELQLTTRVQTAKRVSDNSSAFRLEITAQDARASPATAHLDDWFDRAHAMIISSFLDLTSEKAQVELWRRIDG